MAGVYVWYGLPVVGCLMSVVLDLGVRRRGLEVSSGTCELCRLVWGGLFDRWLAWPVLLSGPGGLFDRWLAWPVGGD